jgi:hypothetical protein
VLANELISGSCQGPGGAKVPSRLQALCGGWSAVGAGISWVWLPEWCEEFELDVIGVAEYQDGCVGLVRDR